MKGAGSPFIGPIDSFFLVSQTVSGDGELSASFLAFGSNWTAEARCGLMMRSSTNVDATFVFIGTSSGREFLWAYRDRAGESPKEIVVPGSPKKLKFRLVRHGKKFECYCDFGAGETRRDFPEINMSKTNYLAALVVSSGNLDQPLEASLQEVKWHPLPQVENSK